MITRTADDLTRLLRAEHWNPFSLLGPHPSTKNGQPIVVVRAFLPEAATAEVLVNGQRAIPMTRVHDEGLFEATIPQHIPSNSYQLQVTDLLGAVTQRHDPYAFPNLVSDFDLHLFAEGRLYRAYQILGAHCILINGVPGVRFVVWAPNAMRVSVVGDFNGWDGRRHQMRNRGAPGLWELFLPDLPEGSLYKYELRPGKGGAPFLKADPYAFTAELRP
ncbi:MAG: 1,4-alpha-glucan branching enzyme, partial [Nitrospirales bacterium]|nr:1,4-alpha-glucan branching enzyme [Nitrospirales bacterium]